MRYTIIILVFLYQATLAQYSKSIPISTEILEWQGVTLYLDKLIVSPDHLTLTFFFYNSSIYGLGSGPIMLRSVYVDNYKDVIISGIKIGQTFYTEHGGKTRFTFDIERPASRLYLKLNIENYSTSEEISFDAKDYPANHDFTSEIRKADNEYELQKRKETTKRIDIEGLRQLKFLYFQTPAQFPPDYLKDLDSASGKIDDKPFLRGDSSLLSLLHKSRVRYFTQPDSFKDNRLKELEIISQAVDSMPFAYHNAYLSSQLQKAKTAYENNSDIFSQIRLEELQRISMIVTGDDFISKQQKDKYLGLLMLGILISLIIFLVFLSRIHRQPYSKPPRNPISQPPPQSRLGNEDSRQQVSDNFASFNGPITNETAFTVLGVTRFCTKEQADQAYRDLIKKYHPDRVSHLGLEFQKIAENKTKDINLAYEIVLKDINKHHS